MTLRSPRSVQPSCPAMPGRSWPFSHRADPLPRYSALGTLYIPVLFSCPVTSACFTACLPSHAGAVLSLLAIKQTPFLGVVCGVIMSDSALFPPKRWTLILLYSTTAPDSHAGADDLSRRRADPFPQVHVVWKFFRVMAEKGSVQQGCKERTRKCCRSKLIVLLLCGHDHPRSYL